MAVFACDAAGPRVPDAHGDAAVDSLLDADLINFPFTGHFIDWDSTTTSPCPIAGATLTVTYDHSRVATTDMDGSFTIPLTTYYSLVDVAPPIEASACTSPISTYTLPGIAVVPPAVVRVGGDFVARSLTTARIATFYAAVGAPFDPTRSNLVVHIDGPPRAVSISSTHDAAQAFDGSVWATGTSGVDIFFPNIVLGTTKTTTVVVAGGAIGVGSVPLAAGSITHMTVVAN